MPKDWFSPDRMTSLSAIPRGARIHVIGVCGVAMAQLAVVLSERGYQVTGSDKEFYEPMGSFLRASAVKLCEGYRAENVPTDVQLVIIGNAVSYGHPEVDVVESRELPYTIFPKILFDLAISHRHSIVVSGTHGKTTTSAMIATALSHLGADPAFFVGGAVPGFSSGLVLGQGAFSVVEGDEYDSSFFAKVPKFSFYAPRSLIVNAVEYDHADIYPNLDAIDREFEQLVKVVPADGAIFMYGDGQHEQELLSKWRSSVSAPLYSFGMGDANDCQVSVSAQESSQHVIVRPGAGKRKAAPLSIEFDLQVPGVHNARNAAAAALVLLNAGFEQKAVAAAVAAFSGVRRRQEVRLQRDKLTIIDDFAHHPTAVRETLLAIRQRYPRGRIIAVFEPRSNTSRRKVFQESYVEAFASADETIMCLPQVRGADTPAELLDVAELAKQIAARYARPAQALPSSAAIQEVLSSKIQNLSVETIILVMSNGSFGGLIANLLKVFN